MLGSFSFSDCPFQFVWINNGCYRFVPSSGQGHFYLLQERCYRSASKLFTPVTERDYLVFEHIIRAYGNPERVSVGVKQARKQ